MHQCDCIYKERKILNEITGRNEEANENIMEEMETLMGATGNKREIRERIKNSFMS